MEIRPAEPKTAMDIYVERATALGGSALAQLIAAGDAILQCGNAEDAAHVRRLDDLALRAGDGGFAAHGRGLRAFLMGGASPAAIAAVL